MLQHIGHQCHHGWWIARSHEMKVLRKVRTRVARAGGASGRSTNVSAIRWLLSCLGTIKSNVPPQVATASAHPQDKSPTTRNLMSFLPHRLRCILLVTAIRSPVCSTHSVGPCVAVICVTASSFPTMRGGRGGKTLSRLLPHQLRSGFFSLSALIWLVIFSTLSLLRRRSSVAFPFCIHFVEMEGYVLNGGNYYASRGLSGRARVVTGNALPEEHARTRWIAHPVRLGSGQRFSSGRRHHQGRLRIK